MTVNGKVAKVPLRDRSKGKSILSMFADRHYFGVSFESRIVASGLHHDTSPLSQVPPPVER